jgi:hypothetical protein
VVKGLTPLPPPPLGHKHKQEQKARDSLGAIADYVVWEVWELLLVALHKVCTIPWHKKTKE